MLSYLTPRIWPFSSPAPKAEPTDHSDESGEVRPEDGERLSTDEPDGALLSEGVGRDVYNHPGSSAAPTATPAQTRQYYPHPPPRHPRSRSATITSRLHPFSTSSPLTRPHPLPPLSRVDPSLTQRLPPLSGGPLRWDRTSWTAFLYFLGSKGYDIVGSLVSYGIYGPPKPSWGLEMTLIAAFMRNVGQHSSLADIGLVRQLISFHHLLPLPPDAIVTPITFRIKIRQGEARLRGLLREWDERETGERELTGEWVVGKKVYRRLKAEKRAGRGKAGQERVIKEDGEGGGESSEREAPVRRHRTEKVIYYIHGGAYYVGSVATHRLITIAISKTCNARVFALNYRLAPETRFPGPLVDVVNGYFRLIDGLRIAPENIIVMGDSAGGGMALAMTMYLRDEGYTDRLPRALVLMSPWVDLTMSCGSWDENAQFDVVPRPGKDDHLNPVACYLGPEGIRKYLTHPYASPLFGDFHGLPPMLIQAGDAEVLRDELTLLAHKAALAGVQVKHELHIDQVHVFQSFSFLESAQVAFQSIGKFVAGLQDVKPSHYPAKGLPDSSGGRIEAGSKDTSSGSTSRSQTPLGVDTVGSEIEHGPTRVVRRDGTEVDAETSDEGGREATRETGIVAEPRQARRKTISGARHDSSGGRSLPTSPRQTRARQPLLRRALSGFTGAREAVSSSADTLDDLSLSAKETRSIFSVFSSASGPPRGEGSHLDAHNAVPKSPRRRRPTVSTVAAVPSRPTARNRSKSHSNVSSLIDSYGTSGPANSTTVYSPSRRGSRDEGDSEDTDTVAGLGLTFGGRTDNSSEERRDSEDSFL